MQEMRKQSLIDSRRELHTKAKAEVDADKLEKLNAKILKKGKELSKDKDDYFSEKKSTQEILEHTREQRDQVVTS